jgi:hypothetical protein
VSRHTPKAFLGKWRIAEMEVWGRDYMDLVVPAHITFEDEAMGRFQFGTVEGWIDCRFEVRDDGQHVEFSWEGQSDTDPGCGRGFGSLISADELHGRIFIHQGDDSAFRAVRSTQVSRGVTRGEAAPSKARAGRSTSRGPRASKR